MQQSQNNSENDRFSTTSRHVAHRALSIYPSCTRSPITHQSPLILSQSLIDEIINAVNTIIYHALEAIENGLLSLPPPTLGFGAEISFADFSIRDTDGNGNVEYPEASAEIENGVHQLETLLEATVDKTFDKFEIYTLRNILTVPDELAGWMRLGHYEVSEGFFYLLQCEII